MLNCVLGTAAIVFGVLSIAVICALILAGRSDDWADKALKDLEQN